MPEATITVELKVRLDPDPLALEQAVAAEARRAGRELLVAAVAKLEEELLARRPGARQRRESRWVSTTFGRVRLERWRIKPKDGPSLIPLDQVLGLAPRTEASVALRELVCDIALRVPFREASWIVSRASGDHHSHQSLWRIVQAEGGAVRHSDGKLVQAVFEFGELPTEILGKASGELVVFFGQHLAIQGMQRYGLHEVPHVLCLHDGLDEYGRTFSDWMPRAVHHIDHFHVAKRLWQATGGDRDAFDPLRRSAFADPAGTAQQIRQEEFNILQDHRAELATYLEGVAYGLWGIKKIPKHLRQARMFIVGTGVAEKHQDLIVGRRMKRRGMRWTRIGADNLLALQGLRFSNRWPTRWGMMAA